MSLEYRIAMYLRLSIEDDGETEESNSITNQRLLISEYVRKNFDLKSIKTVEFCDDGYSGTNMERPGLRALLDEVKENRIQCIIVKDISRFSRDYIDGGTYLNQIFPFMGVRFIGINDNYDSEEHRGSTIELDTAFKTLLYDFYSKDTSAKVKAAFDNKYDSGLFLSATVPFGYTKIREGHQVIINPEEAKIVREIFDMALSGMTSVQIARRLHEKGIPTPCEVRKVRTCKDSIKPIWNNTKVRGILNNQFYTGDMVYGKTRRKAVGSSQFVSIPRSEWKVIPDHHEGIISHEEYEKVARFIPHRPKDNSKRHPLVGKMECGGCGANITQTSRSRNGKYSYFMCLRKRTLKNPDCADSTNFHIMEELVLKELNEQLKVWADAGKGMEAVSKMLKTEISVAKEELKSAENRIKELKAGSQSLYQRYFDKEISADEYRRLKDSDANEMEQCKRKIKDIEEAILDKTGRQNRLDMDMKSVIRNMRIETLNKEIVDTFIKKIVVYSNRRIEIKWNFSAYQA